MHRTCLGREYLLKKRYEYIDAAGTTVVGQIQRIDAGACTAWADFILLQHPHQPTVFYLVRQGHQEKQSERITNLSQ